MYTKSSPYNQTVCLHVAATFSYQYVPKQRDGDTVELAFIILKLCLKFCFWLSNVSNIMILSSGAVGYNVIRVDLFVYQDLRARRTLFLCQLTGIFL